MVSLNPSASFSVELEIIIGKGFIFWDQGFKSGWCHILEEIRVKVQLSRFRFLLALVSASLTQKLIFSEFQR